MPCKALRADVKSACQNPFATSKYCVKTQLFMAALNPVSSSLRGSVGGGARAARWPSVAGVWQADALRAGETPTLTTGHAALDAELPGGGWPLGALMELLHPAGGSTPVWPLVLPALAAHRVGQGIAAVVLVGAPGLSCAHAGWQPHLPALAAAGLSPARLLWLPGEPPAARLWSAEQALRCADVAAVLAWLPRVRATDLRRLQLAAAQRAGGLLFVLRPASVRHEASPASLRLALDMQGEALAVNIVKRRGPPQATPLLLPAQPAALRALLATSAAPGGSPRGSTGTQVLPFVARPGVSGQGPLQAAGGEHAVDRIAVAA